MTLPTPDAQSSRFQLRPSLVPNPTYSMPTNPLVAPEPSLLPPIVPQTELPPEHSQDRAIDFASHSWDLATGGLKTLTAKRELPSLVERRPTEQWAEPASVPRSYAFLLIILVCLLVMLVSGGVVIFVMLQP
ncbi:MAG TPA: hypothetical protein VEV19_06770 [Ktedonobacteraceae bacterium]|nr:hypothetical protein [Ktedonobacteraceae bacterium]